MNRISKSIAAVAAVLLLGFGSSAFAASITINGFYNYRSSSGGEFNVVAADAAGLALLAPSLASGYFAAGGTDMVSPWPDGTQMGSGYGGQLGFETFCLEHGEFISLGGTYSATIEDGAVRGGIGGSPDLISVGTAYLYSEFARGGLADYTYQVSPSAARRLDAAVLQNAFWYLEDEISLADAGGVSNPFLKLVFDKFGEPGAGIGDLAGGAKLNNTLYNVKVLNLWEGAAPAQSQLILAVPDGGLTAMLLGLGLGGLALVRRKLS